MIKTVSILILLSMACSNGFCQGQAGKRDGIHREFYGKKKLMYEYMVKDEKLNGFYEKYDEKGRLEYRQYYIDGIFDGVDSTNYYYPLFFWYQHIRGEAKEIRLSDDEAVEIFSDGYELAVDDIILAPVTGINDGVIPTTTTLCQNYPNPFNPTTEISFLIENTGDIKLNVYNYTGQLVNSLIDGQMNAGLHKVNFDASNLSAGVYYYTLEADNTSITRKMVLVK